MLGNPVSVQEKKLSRFFQLSQDVDSDYDQDDLLKYVEDDEYDRQFEALREEKLKSKRVQVDEDIATAKTSLEEAK